ncbi:MAG: AraC family transcriptional regulator [Flavobacteriaceae bacterium]
MKILKYLLFLLLIAVIGFSVFIGTKDSSFHVSSTKSMQIPVSLAFEQINDLKNWQKWGPWMVYDPNLKMTFEEITVGANAGYSWQSTILGEGTVKTIAVSENDSIFQKIHFVDSENQMYWKLDPTENTTTTVTWGMMGELTFKQKVTQFFKKEKHTSTLKEMLEMGLDNIEAGVQEEMKKYTITVEGIKDYGGGYYLFTTMASNTKELGAKMGIMLGKVASFMEQNNIPQSGMPFTIYNEWDDVNETTIFTTAIPVSEKMIITEGDVLCGFMEPLTAVKIVLKGNYLNLPETYKAGEEYILDNKLVKDPTHKMFEVYTNDPGTIPNPAQWETHVYIPVFKDLRIDNFLIERNP